MKKVHIIAFSLLLIGGLNWAIFALTDWDISQLFGGMDTTVSKIIYILVGLSAIYEIATHKGRCKDCGGGGGM